MVYRHRSRAVCRRSYDTGFFQGFGGAHGEASLAISDGPDGANSDGQECGRFRTKMPVPDRVAATYLGRKSLGRLESLALAVQRDGCPDQMREGSLVDRVTLMKVDGTPDLHFKTRVE